MQLHKFIILIGTGVILFTFFIALLYKKKQQSPFTKYIFIFIILGLLISINTIGYYHFHMTSLYTLRFIQFLLISLQTPCIGMFFLSILSNKPFQKSMKYLIAFFLLLQVFMFVLGILNYLDFTSIYIAISLISLIFSMIYFKDLLNSVPYISLSYNPPFWIVVGLFLHSCISFPIYSLHRFIPFQTQKDLRLAIFSLSNISLIILYVFIIKSYLCFKHQPNL